MLSLACLSQRDWWDSLAQAPGSETICELVLQYLHGLLSCHCHLPPLPLHLNFMYACVSLSDFEKERRRRTGSLTACISENNPLFKCQNTLKFARDTHILNTDRLSLNFMFNWAPYVLSCNSLLGALRPGALWQADCGRRTMTSSLALPRDFMLSYCSVSFKPHPLGVPGSLFLKQSLSSMEQQEPWRVETSILSQAVQLEAT